MGTVLYALVLVWAGIVLLVVLRVLIKGAVAYTGGEDEGVSDMLHPAGGLVFGLIGGHLVLTAPPWGAGLDGKIAVSIGLSLGLSGLGYLLFWVFWARR